MPGTAQDVPRRLGVEVVKFPYITKPKPWNDTTLVAGQPGKLLLESGRLWRSTVVMLGTQRADRIEVLPDMQGVSAHFYCVETPNISWNQEALTDSQGPKPLTLAFGQVVVPVRVWTSEGSTTPTFAVKVQIPKDIDHSCQNKVPTPNKDIITSGN